MLTTYAADKSFAAIPEHLAKILFDDLCHPAPQTHAISTGLSLLDGQACEYISSALPITHGHDEKLLWAETDEYMFIALWADESDTGELALSTEHLYTRLLHTIRTHGYPFLVKVWNYFADINHIDHDLERYRQFCVGRFNAFEALGITEDQYPSACALGHRGGELLVYAVASKKAALHFENPQQSAAYHYPAEYGPRSPSFARASLLTIGESTKIFVSGTASVVGFVTQHPYELEPQIRVTLENLEYLFEHICKTHQFTHQNLAQLPRCEPEVIKVYVRNANDVDTIKAQVSKAYPNAPTVYVAADICRSDLLLEIDGLWNLLD